MTNDPITLDDRDIYSWQMSVPEFGEKGQAALKNATVLISRCGGVGGAVAYYLAAAGIGRLVLAHAGNIRPNDLNRQILMTHEGIGSARVESAARRLRELNPRLAVDAVNENISEANVERLTRNVDMVVDCAPLFEERYLLNRESMRRGIPLIECAMYELEAQITSMLAGRTPCLACLHPISPPIWKREFPVLGAVAGMVGCLGAAEAVKIIAGFGEPLYGRMLRCDLRTMNFRTVKISRDPACAVCMQKY